MASGTGYRGGGGDFYISKIVIGKGCVSQNNSAEWEQSLGKVEFESIWKIPRVRKKSAPRKHVELLLVPYLKVQSLMLCLIKKFISPEGGRVQTVVSNICT